MNEIMKWSAPLIFVMILVGCQQERLEVNDSPTESSIMNDAQLVSLLRSVASHDGSFDDSVDNADCFSINFPYGILVNGVPHNITSPEDLGEIPPANSVVPQFPITLTMCNYNEVEVTDLNQLYDYIIGCHSGELFNDVITCVDLGYPVDLSMYNSSNSNFETVTLQHDWDVYSTLETLDPSMLVTLQYPIHLLNQNGDTLVVNSNQDLKFQIARISSFCN